MTDRRSVQPEWCMDLSLQQQSVLLLASRGPDGIPKSHPCKDVQRAYRGTVLVAGRYGRLLYLGEAADTFMSMDLIANQREWARVVKAFFHEVDSLPLHFVMHLLHGAEILGYKHPDWIIRERWSHFYQEGVRELHLAVETEDQMDARLADWGREEWEQAG